MRTDKCRCGHIKASHATEYGMSGAFCRVLFRHGLSSCMCAKFESVKNNKRNHPHNKGTK